MQLQCLKGIWRYLERKEVEDVSLNPANGISVDMHHAQHGQSGPKGPFLCCTSLWAHNPHWHSIAALNHAVA